MFEEQLMQLLARAVATAVGATQAAAAAAVPVPGGSAGGGHSGGNGGGGRVLRENGFSEIPKLSRGQDQWADWSYDFKIARATMSPEMRRTLEVIQDLPQTSHQRSCWTLSEPRR